MNALTRPTMLGALMLMLVVALPLGAQESCDSSCQRQRDRARERERAERVQERTRERESRGSKHDRDEDDHDSSGEPSARIDTTIAFDRTGIVDLGLMSGEIIVTAWDRAEARIQATTESGALDSDLSHARITIETRSHRGRSGETHYELTVPAGARVMTRSESGNVTIRGVKGEVEAHTMSGDIEVSDAADRVTLESLSGGVHAMRVAGSVRGSSVSGDAELQNIGGDVDFESVSGSIQITQAKSKIVRTESVSGEISYEGTVDPSGRYQFSTQSGDVRLRIPAATGAKLTMQTFSGSLDSAFPVTLQPGQRARQQRFEFTIGSGGASISAETFSGDVTIEKQR